MSDVLSTTAQGPGYWRETRQPIYSAALVLPFLLAYELGLLFLRSEVINGGDAILLSLGGSIMRLLGLRGSFASVVVLLLVFVLAQIKRKGSWRVRPPLLLAAFFESLLYAALLFIILGYFIQYLPVRSEFSSLDLRVERAACSVQRAGCTDHDPRTTRHEESKIQSRRIGTESKIPSCPPTMAGVSGPEPMGRPSVRPGLRDFILYCGAGVYEELVFRVMLLSLLLLAFTKLFHMEHAYAAVWAVVLGAVIFSAFHHIGGQAFALGVFLQRVFAGLYFAALYFNRSFGVAAASHAMYDILVGLNHYV